jgi:hypothetical protein
VRRSVFCKRSVLTCHPTGPALYPPTTPAALRRLLGVIHASSIDRLKKDCFFYYLLRDYDAFPSPTAPPRNGGNHEMGEMDAAAGPSEEKGRAESFARRRCLPKMWRTFMDGYWALDHEMWEVRAFLLVLDSCADDAIQDAVDALSDPAITELNFVPSILQIFTTSVSPPSRALSLVHFFLTTTGYLPDSPAETTIQLLAIASTVSLSTAFSFIRSKEDASTRTALRYAVWCWMLGSPSHSGSAGAGAHGVQKRAVEESLHLPLLPEENAHLVHFLSHPPKTVSPQAVSLLHDLVTLRLVHGGQYAESLQLDKELAGSGGKDGDRQRRREMVREFIAILPEAQRRALQIEGEALAGQREKDRSEMANGFVVSEDVDMGGSWIGVSEPPAAVAVAAVRPEVPPIEPASVMATATATATAQVFAPEPIRSLASSTSLSQLAQTPRSPAPQPPRTTASPFSGPPRFSQGTSTPGSPMRRVLSGSPFTPPTNTISPKGLPIPKPARKIIDDEADLVRAVTRRGKASKRLSVEPPAGAVSQDQDELQVQDEDQIQHPDQGQEMMPPPPPPPAVSQNEEAEEAPITPAPRRTTRRAPTSAAKAPPPPPSPSTRTRRARQTTAPPQPSPLAMPGSFDAPTSPIRATSAAPGTGARLRMTRSVSRALLDDDIEELRPTPKKARSNRKAREGTAASETTDDGVTAPGPGPTPRRSTRRGGTAQPSEGGSPTPSVAGSVVSTRSAGARTTRAREGSATPRMTRARKA